MRIRTLKALVEAAEAQETTIASIVLDIEASESGRSVDDIRNEMAERIAIMRDSMRYGLENPVASKSGLIRGGAYMVARLAESGGAIIGGLFTRAVSASMAVAEVNACMGRIVAAPTGGSCGVLPGTLITLAEERRLDERVLIDAFVTAGGIGVTIEKQATLSGAEGGCQAECGAASAMAAGAIVEMMGGGPRKASNAVAFAFKNILGLICDPVCGLVEVPCVKRNAMGAVNAFAAAEIAMAGVESVVPADEIIVAMGNVGKQLPVELRETGKGGTAATPTAKEKSRG